MTLPQCPRCLRHFAQSLGLARHLARCKADPPAIEPLPEAIPLPPVHCLDCGEPFSSARGMGIHQTVTHFGKQSLIQSQLSNARR